MTAPRVSRKRKVEENVAYTEAEADSVFGANSINPGELLPNAEPENQAPIRRARKKVVIFLCHSIINSSSPPQRRKNVSRKPELPPETSALRSKQI